MKLKKAIPAGVAIALAITGLMHWLDKPYCSLELLEAHTVREQRNLIVYAITKITPQRRELHGNDPYRLYLRIDDPDGVKSVSMTVNGKPIRLEWKEGDRTIQQEIQGVTDFGLHHYTASVTDQKGNTARAEAHIKVSASGGFVPVI